MDGAFKFRADTPPTSDEVFLAARTQLNQRASHGPYLGAGLEPGLDDGETSGALVGGVAAPFVEDTTLFGEMQHVERSDGEDEKRFWLGVRSGF